MSPESVTQKRFEEHIEKELNSLNYSSRNYKDCDKELVIKDEVINFKKNTQPQKWNKFNSSYGIDKECSYDNEGLDPSEEYFRKKKKSNDEDTYSPSEESEPTHY